MTNRTVLLVDDDPALLEALPRALRLRLPDVDVATCDSAAEALQLVRRVDYDAIVSDIKMPGMDGLSLLAMIRRIRPRTPTLLITGHGEHDLTVQALRGGAYDFIQKPIDRDYFVASLVRALQVSDLQRRVDGQTAALERRAAELERSVRERTRTLLEANHVKDELLAERERALEEARAAQRRLSFLAEAGDLLTSLDYDTTLENVVRLAIPTLAEICVVEIPAGSGRTERCIVAAASPEIEQRVEAELDAMAARDGGGPLFESIAAVGAGARLDPSGLDPGEALGDGQVELLKLLGSRSVIVAPMVTRGRTLGTICLGMGDTARLHDEGDVALARDIARRCAMAIDNARLFAEAEEATEHLRRASEAKDEFLALISHEMRTPLTSVYGSAQILWNRGDRLAPERRAELIESLGRESERMRRIVEDLLVLARVEIGGQVPVEPVSVPAVVRTSVRRFSALEPDREVSIELPQEAPLAAGETTYVEQVVHNLLSNAHKYSPRGEQIDLRVSSDADRVVVSVLDRGVGVDASEIELIFERFYRSGATTAPGVGMGLTVCRRLVEALAGEIWAAPRDGGGLEVSFSMPLWRSDEAGDLLAERAAGGEALAGPAMDVGAPTTSAARSPSH